MSDERHNNPVLAGGEGTRSEQHGPSAALAPYVLHYWTAAWDVPDGQVRTARVLNDACMHVVWEGAKVDVVGVVKKTFERELRGASRVIGVKLRPGAARLLLLDRPASLVDRRVDLIDEAFTIAPGLGVPALDPTAREIAACTSLGDAVPHLEAFLAPRFARTAADHPSYGLVCRAIDGVVHDPELDEVSALASALAVSVRVLQRAFREYVGVTPKWLIRRVRLQDAARALKEGRATNLAELAARLGYFDQAHLARDFKDTTGLSPRDFRRGVASG